jgi:outer membrane protein assembly factor BamA
LKFGVSSLKFGIIRHSSFVIRHSLSLFLSFFLSLPASAQSDYVHLTKIVLEGNKKTKETTILRELNLHVGDSVLVSEMGTRLEENQKRLMSTGLFEKAELNIKNWNTTTHSIEFQVKVKEVVSFYVLPWIELADRNFNVWWNEKHHSLKRLNYSGTFVWRNMTGRKDPLRAKVQVGFTPKIELDYKQPALNKQQTLGMNANVFWSRDKEVWYNTIADKLQRYRNEQAFQLYRNRASLGLTYRPKLFTIHQVRLEYNQNKVADTIALVLNPNFFSNNATKEHYWAAEYLCSIDRRDFRYYPKKGFLLNFSVKKNGLLEKDNNQALFLTTMFAKYITFSSKNTAEIILKGRKEVSGAVQSYYNSRALGYNTDYLRAYDYNVIDGTDFAYLKSSFRHQLLDTKIDMNAYLPDDEVKVPTFPIAVSLTFNNDFGITNNPTNRQNNALNNRLLWGGGIGLDFFLLNRYWVQVETNINQSKKVGLFFRYKAAL